MARAVLRGLSATSGGRLARTGRKLEVAMLMLAAAGTLTVKFGHHVERLDTDRLAETLEAFAPVSVLTLDFGDVRAIDAEALVLLARALRGLASVRIRVRSLAWRQLRVLEMLGVAAEDMSSRAIAPDRR